MKAMGKLRVPQLLSDSNWSTRYNIPKKYRYSNSSTYWIFVSLNFDMESYGIKFTYDQVNTPHVEKCFSNITTTHSKY